VQKKFKDLFRQKNDTAKIVVSEGPIGQTSNHKILVLNSNVKEYKYSKINVPLERENGT
jgi:hypothetical protein